MYNITNDTIDTAVRNLRSRIQDRALSESGVVAGDNSTVFAHEELNELLTESMAAAEPFIEILRDIVARDSKLQKRSSDYKTAKISLSITMKVAGSPEVRHTIETTSDKFAEEFGALIPGILHRGQFPSDAAWATAGERQHEMSRGKVAWENAERHAFNKLAEMIQYRRAAIAKKMTMGALGHLPKPDLAIAAGEGIRNAARPTVPAPAGARMGSNIAEAVKDKLDAAIQRRFADVDGYDRRIEADLEVVQG